MTSSPARTLVLAGIAAILTAIPAAASVAPSGSPVGASPKAVAIQYAGVQCMTDDGYGRLRSCSANYRKEHPNWRSGDECVTDDGYGRTRPCSNQYKRRHKRAN